VLRNPANRRRAVPLSFEQFRYGFANALSEAEAKELYETSSVPGSGAPIFQAAAANLNPFSEAKVDVDNPDRGPLLITSGGEGPSGAGRDREGLVQAPAAQHGGD
jgi:non-heme chloroperoxidase